MKPRSRIRWMSNVLRFQASVSRLEFSMALLVCLVLKQGVDRWGLNLLGASYDRHILGVMFGVVLPTREDES